MTSLAVAASFKPRLAELSANLPQSLLLHGEVGIGLGSVARHLAGRGARVLQPTNRQGELDFETGTISVEAVRLLYEQTRAKSNISQVIIIESADLMSPGAQNAFLKLLEEPASMIRFILTTHQKDSLLPTILSRVQSRHVPRISDSQSRLLLSKAGLDQSEQAKVLFLAMGRPGLLHRLATDSKLRQSVSDTIVDAREFLNNRHNYRGLVIALKYTKNRAEAERFVDAVMAVLKHTLYNSPQTNSLDRVEQIEAARINLSANANPKLQLMQLVLK